MDVEIEIIDEKDRERVQILCHDITEEVREIESFVRARQGRLLGISEGSRYAVALSEIYYIESVEGRTFLYTKDNVYEAGYRLYELEERLRENHFLRISKAMMVNLMKIQSIKPALNGRFTAVLQSGEEVIISRNYVKKLKSALKGEW